MFDTSFTCWDLSFKIYMQENRTLRKKETEGIRYTVEHKILR